VFASPTEWKQVIRPVIVRVVVYVVERAPKFPAANRKSFDVGCQAQAPTPACSSAHPLRPWEQKNYKAQLPTPLQHEFTRYLHLFPPTLLYSVLSSLLNRLDLSISLAASSTLPEARRQPWRHLSHLQLLPAQTLSRRPRCSVEALIVSSVRSEHPAPSSMDRGRDSLWTRRTK